MPKRYVVKPENHKNGGFKQGGKGKPPVPRELKARAVTAWWKEMVAGKTQIKAAEVVGHAVCTLERWEKELEA